MRSLDREEQDQARALLDVLNAMYPGDPTKQLQAVVTAVSGVACSARALASDFQSRIMPPVDISIARQLPDGRLDVLWTGYTDAHNAELLRDHMEYAGGRLEQELRDRIPHMATGVEHRFVVTVRKKALNPSSKPGASSPAVSSTSTAPLPDSGAGHPEG